jgi:hypothetical protein
VKKQSGNKTGSLVTIKAEEYVLARVPPGLDRWAAVVRKKASGAEYRVALDWRGRWRCSCPAWKYFRSPDGRRREPDERCKHASEIKRLHSLALAMTGL